jgi:hypothetical protein
MLRAILSVIVGYIIMVAVVFCGLTIAWFAMGADRAFQPEVFDLSIMWVATSFVVGLLAAIIGGRTCHAIARSARPPKMLARLVLVLGVLMAVPAFQMASKPAAARTGAETMFQVMEHARTPVWAALVTPAIGAIGVMIGASIGAGAASRVAGSSNRSAPFG